MKRGTVLRLLLPFTSSLAFNIFFPFVSPPICFSLLCTIFLSDPHFRLLFFLFLLSPSLTFCSVTKERFFTISLNKSRKKKLHKTLADKKIKCSSDFYLNFSIVLNLIYSSSSYSFPFLLFPSFLVSFIPSLSLTAYYLLFSFHFLNTLFLSVFPITYFTVRVLFSTSSPLSSIHFFPLQEGEREREREWIPTSVSISSPLRFYSLSAFLSCSPLFPILYLSLHVSLTFSFVSFICG